MAYHKVRSGFSYVKQTKNAVSPPETVNAYSEENLLLILSINNKCLRRTETNIKVLSRHCDFGPKLTFPTRIGPKENGFTLTDEMKN